LAATYRPLDHAGRLSCDILGSTNMSSHATSKVNDHPGPASLSYEAHYKLFRDYIEHEDSLINERLLWIINIQGFLFATYGFSVQKLADVQALPHAKELAGAKALYWLILILPILGVAISFYSLKGVKAAQNAIRQLTADWLEARKQHTGHPPRILSELPKLPVIIGGGYKGRASGDYGGHSRWAVFPGHRLPDAHSEGFRAPIMFPVIFIVVWLLLLISFSGLWIYYLQKFGLHF
jgi:hypothetical protein